MHHHYTMVIFMRLLRIFFLIFQVLLVVFFSKGVFAQNINLNDNLPFGIESRYKLLVLPFATEGITEITAKSFAKQFSQSLKNTEHYDVVASDDLETHLITINSDLLNCFEISCGITLAKDFNADFVVVSSVKLINERPFLKILLVDAYSNKTIFQDELLFDKNQINKGFYTLANRIIEHTPVIGKVIQSNDKFININLGKAEKIKVSDHIVIYRQTDEADDGTLPENSLNHVLAVIKIIRLAQNTAEGTYRYVYELPAVGDKVMAYIDREKQAIMIAESRKQIDTSLRLVVREDDLDPVPPIEIIDKRRAAWEREIFIAQSSREFYWFSMIAGTLGSVYIYTSGGAKITPLLAVGVGFTGYSVYRYLNERERVETLTEEGRYKNYIDNNDIISGINVSRDRTIQIASYQVNF